MKASLIFIVLGLFTGCMDTELHPIKDGTGGAAPKIEINPSEINWDYISPSGVSDSVVVTINSVGTENLTVSDIQVDDDGGGAFSLTDSIGMGVYRPGTSSDFVIVYTSLEAEADGTLKIVSDDPENPIYHVPLHASGEIQQDTNTDTSPPLAAPIAVCSADPSEVEAIHESASWIGDSSYDPDGTITTWQWNLIAAPSGATATMPAGGANRHGFTPDVAGDYVAQLVVVDNDGLSSDPCDATLTATAGKGLWVETFWTHSGDDMDLHLLRGSGAIESRSDCYYANCVGAGLDWGVAGDPADDPSLDLDDITAVGPENINIGSPAASSYTVIVRDYPGSVYNRENDVTVNIYVGGALVWSETRNINSEGCYEEFATVTIPGGAVSSLPSTCH
jgi:hypothetical protein